MRYSHLLERVRQISTGREVSRLRERAGIAGGGRPPTSRGDAGRLSSWEALLKQELGLSRSSAYRYEALWREAEVTLGSSPGEEAITVWLESRPSRPGVCRETPSAPSPTAAIVPKVVARRTSRRGCDPSSSSMTPADARSYAVRKDALQLAGLVDHFVRSKAVSRLDASTRGLLVRCLTDCATDLARHRR